MATYHDPRRRTIDNRAAGRRMSVTSDRLAVHFTVAYTRIAGGIEKMLQGRERERGGSEVEAYKETCVQTGLEKANTAKCLPGEKKSWRGGHLLFVHFLAFLFISCFPRTCLRFCWPRCTVRASA